MEDIDREVAEKVMGWNPNEDGDWDTPDGHWCGYYEHEWHPSTSISDAWQVVEKLNKQGIVISLMDQHGYDEEKNNYRMWRVGFMDEKAHEQNKSREQVWFEVEEADTAPLAICMAALKAVG